MKTRTQSLSLVGPLVVSLAVVVGFMVTCPLAAQETQTAEPTPVPTPAPAAISASEIPGRTADVRRLLRETRTNSQYGELLAAISAEFESEAEHIVDLEEETQRRLETDGPASVIEEAEKVWIRSGNRLEGWLELLSAGAESVTVQHAVLGEELLQWQLTRDAADDEELPEAVRQQVEETIQSIEAAQVDLYSTRDAILTLQSDVARKQSLVDDQLAIQREEIVSRRQGMIGVDSPPIWKAFVSPGVHGAPSEQIAVMWSKNFVAVRDYVRDHRGSLRLHLFIVIILTIGVIYYRRTAALWEKHDRSLERTVRILDRPFAAALIITLLMGGLLHPSAPSAWHDFMGLILLFAILRMLPRMLSDEMRPVAYQLAGLYFLRQIVRLAPDGNLVNRLALLAAAAAGFFVCLWLLLRLKQPRPNLTEGWRWVLKIYLRIVAIAFLLSAIANIVGGVGFATLVILGTLYSLFSAVFLWVAVVLMEALVRVGMLTRTARSFGIVRLHADTVRETLVRWARVAAVVAWAYYTHEGFVVVENTTDALKGLLEKQISIGDFSLAPADIVIFFVVVWLTFKISQLLSFILETDVLPNLNLPRGVPGAITRLTHYAIVVIGVMIGAAAAGLDFSRINLIIGALGVGIGFGLQNVVNNFVSGLILLFERPIRVGDKVQLDTLFGIVKNIGMRASIVRTYQGAEVIVPNANLISSEVINWTLSDDRRRMELPVGVAYGTDPQFVIDLLVGVAEEHEDVMSDPAPAALFLGFGDSSLNFQIRAWTRSDYVRVSSDLLVATNSALAAAGIEVPFPQRDLHLRSVEAGLSLEIPPGDRGVEPEVLDHEEKAQE